MGMWRTLSSVVVTVLVVLSVPVVAGARAPIPLRAARAPPPLTPPPGRAGRAAARAVALRGLWWAPAAARAGNTYVLRGAVVNESSVATRPLLVVHLLRVGSPPVAVGEVSLRLPAHDLVVYRVHV